MGVLEVLGDVAGGAIDLAVDGVIAVHDSPILSKVALVTATAATGGLAAAASAGTIASTLGATGVLGASSTGTAMSSLTGVALEKASLAAIGGGSIAAGGGGVALGQSIITGLGALSSGTVAGVASQMATQAVVNPNTMGLSSILSTIFGGSIPPTITHIISNNPNLARNLTRLIAGFAANSAVSNTNNGKVNMTELQNLIIGSINQFLANSNSNKATEKQKTKSKKQKNKQ